MFREAGFQPLMVVTVMELRPQISTIVIASGVPTGVLVIVIVVAGSIIIVLLCRLVALCV